MIYYIYAHYTNMWKLILLKYTIYNQILIAETHKVNKSL